MKITALPTEQQNADTIAIDEVSTLEMLRMINKEDQKVALYVEKHLDKIAAAADAAAEKFICGGRIVYCGAGTSGRMGFMDSSECPPTYGVEEGRVVSVMAGGLAAIGKAIEGAEDDEELGAKDLKDIGFCRNDVLVGIAASGRTPYVIGAVKYAKELGAATISVTCDEDFSGPINSLVSYPIAIYAGPEAITGSTRMKAGTVQKMVLNMFSTAIMVKSGKVYGNLMVNVQIKNEKLLSRAKSIIQEITSAPESDINAALKESENSVPLSILMLLTGYGKGKAEQLLARAGGNIKKAIEKTLQQ